MTEPYFDLTGRTAVVTGGSSGLGVTFANALASAGANVVIGARRADRLEQVAKGIEAAGGTALAVTCDVTEEASVEAMMDQAIKAFGRVDIVVNNAGSVADGGPMPEKIPSEAVEWVMKVNFLGVLHGAKAGAARMLADGKGGSIINIASVGGASGQPGYPAGYAASKAAVVNLTQTLAVNWADRGVRVNALAPGWFPSEMADPFLDVPIFKASIIDRVPMGRIGNPDELIGPLLFLASNASAFVTGHILTVDGGMSASFGAPRYSDELYEFHATAVPGLGERIMPPA